MAKSTVAALRVKPTTILEDVRRLCELAGIEKALDRRAPTVLKDHVRSHRPFPSFNTTPWQLEGVVRTMHEHGHREVACVQNNQRAYEAPDGEDPNHYLPLFRKYDLSLKYNFREEDMRWIEFRPRARMHVLDKVFPRGIRVPDFFEGKNVVHLPTAKCDRDYVIASAAQNALGGFLDDERRVPRALRHRALVDLLAVQKELHSGLFSVCDATTAGNGAPPDEVVPFDKGWMLASSDPVALDTVLAKMMGFDPKGIEYLRVAHDDKLGVGDPADIAIAGDEDALREHWGFSVRERAVSPVRAMLSKGPLGRVKGALARSPVGNALALGGELYEDYYRWPLREKRVFEHWQINTVWGRLFARYGREGSIAPAPPPPVPSLIPEPPSRS